MKALAEILADFDKFSPKLLFFRQARSSADQPDGISGSRPSGLALDRRRCSCRALTLVEVTLALGLVSFAAISILGLLPMGLTSLRQSMEQTVEAQILARVAAQTAVSAFSKVSPTGITSYFDEQGQALSVTALGAPKKPDSVFFTVKVSAGPAVFPGSTDAFALSSSLTGLQVLMISKPPRSTLGGKTSLYTLQLANSGK